MIIGAISDTHGYYPNSAGWPELDIFIHAGDIVGDPSIEIAPTPELDIIHQIIDLKERFIPWLQQVKAKHKIVILGNHDRWGEQDSNIDILRNECTVLCNEDVVVNGLKIWGSPYSLQTTSSWRPYRPFRAKEDALELIYKKIPDDVDIIISHTPPWRVLDFDSSGGVELSLDYQNWGSRALATRLKDFKHKIVIVGHAHNAFGCTCFCGNAVYNTSLPSLFNIQGLVVFDFEEIKLKLQMRFP